VPGLLLSLFDDCKRRNYTAAERGEEITIIPREPYYGMTEPDKDFVKKNFSACVELLERELVSQASETLEAKTQDDMLHKFDELVAYTHTHARLLRSHTDWGDMVREFRHELAKQSVAKDLSELSIDLQMALKRLAEKDYSAVQMFVMAALRDVNYRLRNATQEYSEEK